MLSYIRESQSHKEAPHNRTCDHSSETRNNRGNGHIVLNTPYTNLSLLSTSDFLLVLPIG